MRDEFQRSIDFWKQRELEEKEMMMQSRKRWKKLEREMKKWNAKYTAEGTKK